MGDPAKRMSAAEALDHDWFWSDPMPCEPASLGIKKFPSSHEFVTKKRRQEAKDKERGPHAKRRQPSHPQGHMPNAHHQGSSGATSIGHQGPGRPDSAHGRPHGRQDGVDMRGGDAKGGKGGKGSWKPSSETKASGHHQPSGNGAYPRR